MVSDLKHYLPFTLSSDPFELWPLSKSKIFCIVELTQTAQVYIDLKLKDPRGPNLA